MIEPVPAWTKEPDVTAASPSATSANFLLLDRQLKYEGPQSVTFVRMVLHPTTAAVLSSFGTISVPWNPGKGNLHMHRVSLTRDGKTIDVLGDGKSLTVLRREAGLERSEINGVLTATLQVPDLRVGDMLDIAYSFDEADPALQGHVNAAYLFDVGQMKPAHSRIIAQWEKSRAMRWQINDDRIKPVITNTGKTTELLIDGPFPAPRQFPDDAPIRMRRPAIIELSDFANWESVSQVNARLYASKPGTTIDPDLASEIDRIKAASPDPRVRATAALRLVQDKIRYLFNGMDGGNYVPTPANQSWNQRYGDCKAKTQLLITVLRELGIEAEPALIAARVTGYPLVSLPSMLAFDHVIVRAKIDGKTVWLDGTDSGATLADLDNGYPYMTSLPVRPKGSGLEPVIAKAPSEPTAVMEATIDARAGLRLPALVTIKVTGGRKIYDLLRQGQASASPKDFQTLLDTFFAFYSGAMTGGTVAVFDEKKATVDVIGKGIFTWATSVENGVTKLTLPTQMDQVNFAPDRSTPMFASMPFAQSTLSSEQWNTILLLPDAAKNATLEGDQQSTLAIGGQKFEWTLARTGQTIMLTDKSSAIPAEIPATDFPAIRTAVQQAVKRKPTIQLPMGYPTKKSEYQAASKSPYYKALLAQLDQLVQSEPEDSTQALAARAQFYVNTQNYDAAIADLTTILTRDSTADQYLTRAQIYEKKKDMANALKDVEAARALGTDTESAVERLVWLRRKAKAFDVALKEIDEAMDAGLDKSAMLQLRADVLADSGKIDAGLVAMDQAVEKASDTAIALNARCWFKATHNVALESAIKDCSKAIEQSDEPWAYFDSRALVYLQMGRFDESIADYDKTLKNWPETAPSLFGRGIAKLRKGDKPGGAADIAAAQEADPDVTRTFADYGLKP